MQFSRLHIAVFLAIAALAWLIVLLYQGTPVTWAHGSPFAIVVGVLAALGFGLNRFLWSCSFLHDWFIKCPDLRGTWRIELQSSYVDPQTNEPIPMFLCYMGIKQTLSELKMHLMTPNSESWVVASHIRPSPSGNGYQVIGVYRNEPSILAQEKGDSAMHHGAFIIDTHGSNVRPDTLTSKYWTDRKTVGTMDFTRRVGHVYTRFEDACKAFSEQRSTH